MSEAKREGVGSVVLWTWIALFGIWPLAHPSHTTLSDPVTWLDLVLHVVGFVSLVPVWWRFMQRVTERS